MGIGFEGGSQKNNVPADERARNLKREAFPEIDGDLLDHIPEEPRYGAANEPFAIQKAIEPITRKAVETDQAELARLLALAETQLELASQINLRPGFNADTDPTAPTGMQTIAAKQIFAGTRADNLIRVVQNQEVPMRAGGEIPGDINKVQIVANEVPSWQKPAPARDLSPKPTSLWQKFRNAAGLK